MNMFDTNDIYSVHLSTGHIIISQVTDDGGEQIVLDFPFAVTPIMNGDGSQGITLVEYMPYSLESQVKLSKAAIVSISPTASKVKDIYIKFLSKLLLATINENAPVKPTHNNSTIH